MMLFIYMCSAVVVLHTVQCLYSIFYSRKWMTHQRAITLKSKLLKRRYAQKHATLDYDPTNCKSLDRFEPSKRRSPCLFAKQAKLWGSCEYNRSQSIEENMLRVVPALCKFVSLVEDDDQPLDGFLIEIRGGGASVAMFAATVRSALSVLSKCDPSGLDPLRMKSISSSSWYFSFDMVPMFITTFAPCYPRTNPRHLHLTSDNLDSCFLLLQPENSFLRHGIGADEPSTNWNYPHTMRDKIRVNFRARGQEYFVPPSLTYPVAATFVQGEHSMLGLPVPFWNEDKYPSTADPVH